jgi:hypothetical protein
VAKDRDWAALDAKGKENWLKEHLPYELMMMRHSLRRLQQRPRPFFLDWNMALAGFAVSARNLRAFLTNKEDEGSGVRACDYVPGFKSTRADLKDTFNLMDPYIFHLGKRRPTDAESSDKFSLDDVAKISEWIEAEMQRFVEALPKETGWPSEAAIPPEPPPEPPGAPVLVIDDQNQTSSSHAQLVSSKTFES